MKMRHSVKWMLIGVLSMPNLTACSFGGDDEEAEEIEASDEGNAANVESDGNETAVVDGAEGTDANTVGNDGNAAFDENAGNNAAADGGVASNDIPPELLNSENPIASMGADNAAMGTDNAAMGEGMPMGSEGNLAANPVPEAMPAADAAIPAATDAVAAAPQLPSGDSRVYYVSVESLALYSGPSATGGSIGQLRKGDPVLVKIEGAWANVLNRGYVEVASLSQAPVGRSSAPAKTWH